MDQSIQNYLKPELDEASKVLLRAAELIEKHGWCQNAAGDMEGSVCLWGAIQAAQGIEPGSIIFLDNEAWDRIFSALRYCPIRWNDAPGRTQAEVCAKLRAVALAGRTEEG